MSRGFIWKPWFSRLELQLRSTFDYSTTQIGGTQGSATSERWTNVSGGTLGLALFPNSRIPFNLNFSVDQQINSEVGLDSRAYRLRLRQRYSPLHRRSLKLAGRYERDVRDGGTRSDNQLFEFTVDDVLDLHVLMGEYQWRKNATNDSERISHSVLGRHNYSMPTFGFSTSNFASYILTEEERTESRAEVAQLVNNSRWIPRLYRGKLDYSSVTRGSVSESGAGLADVQSLAFSHGSRLKYKFTNELQAFGGFNYSARDVGNGWLSTTSEQLGVDYISRYSPWREWQHRWSANTLFSALQSVDRNTESWTAGADHRLRKDISVSAIRRARIEFSQGVDADLYRDDFNQRYGLSHSADYFWSESLDEVFSSVQLTFSDGRELSGSAAEQQLLTARVDHDRILDNGASLKTDIKSQLFRRKDTSREVGVGYSLNGNSRYALRAVFRIPRLS